MEKKFNVGDRVRINPDTTQGMGYFGFRDKDAVVINAWPERDLYEISIGDKPLSTAANSDCLVMVEPYDAKKSFLSELKKLLSKYGAKIDCSDYDTGGEWWYEKWLSIKIGEEEIKWFDDGDDDPKRYGQKPLTSHFPLTANNLMGYNKE